MVNELWLKLKKRELDYKKIVPVGNSRLWLTQLEHTIKQKFQTLQILTQKTQFYIQTLLEYYNTTFKVILKFKHILLHSTLLQYYSI